MRRNAVYARAQYRFSTGPHAFWRIGDVSSYIHEDNVAPVVNTLRPSNVTSGCRSLRPARSYYQLPIPGRCVGGRNRRRPGGAGVDGIAVNRICFCHSVSFVLSAVPRVHVAGLSLWKSCRHIVPKRNRNDHPACRRNAAPEPGCLPGCSQRGIIHVRLSLNHYSSRNS